MKYFFVVLLAVSTGAFALGFPVETGDVTWLQIHRNPNDETNSGRRYILRLSGTISPNSCGNEQWTGFVDDEIGAAQYSALLAAAASGKTIKVEGTSHDLCESGSVLIRNVYFVY